MLITAQSQANDSNNNKSGSYSLQPFLRASTVLWWLLLLLLLLFSLLLCSGSRAAQCPSPHPREPPARSLHSHPSRQGCVRSLRRHSWLRACRKLGAEEATAGRGWLQTESKLGSPWTQGYPVHHQGLSSAAKSGPEQA